MAVDDAAGVGAGSGGVGTELASMVTVGDGWGTGVVARLIGAVGAWRIASRGELCGTGELAALGGALLASALCSCASGDSRTRQMIPSRAAFARDPFRPCRITPLPPTGCDLRSWSLARPYSRCRRSMHERSTFRNDADVDTNGRSLSRWPIDVKANLIVPPCIPLGP
jgi:hypothetical protein